MDTLIYKLEKEKINTKNIRHAADIIKNGGLVAFPTETVYGLGANGLDSTAVNKIFLAKGRPNDNPLILHIAKFEMLSELAEINNNKIIQLTEMFWPGPLTIVLPKKSVVPNEVSAGLNTVAVRMPNHPIALELIKESNVPIAAPSANLSGKPSPTIAQHVIKDLSGKVDIIIDGGATGIGIESTVLDLSSEVPLILRPGGVTKEQLEKVLGEVRLDLALVDQAKAPKSPGMKYTHYSPEANVTIIQGEYENVKQKIEELCKLYIDEGKRVAILVTQKMLNELSLTNVQYKENLGDVCDLTSAAQRLYAALRDCDEMNIDEVLVEALPIEGIGLAVMNRLEKAAGYNILVVK